MAAAALQWANTDLEHQIGERRRIEEELSKSEERFRSLVQNLQVGGRFQGRAGKRSCAIRRRGASSA